MSMFISSSKASTGSFGHVLQNGKGLLPQFTTGSSIFIGENAGASDDGSNNRNIGIGKNALDAATTGHLNIAIGDDALTDVTTGNHNVAIGFESQKDTTGGNNTSVGYNSLEFNTSGNNNVAIGYAAAGGFTYSGADNVAIGFAALGGNNVSGDFNIAIGKQALYANTAADDNLAIGDFALTSAGTDANSSKNLAIGSEALRHIVYTAGSSGFNNTALGWNAGTRFGDNAGNLTSASYSVFIGHTTFPLENNSTNEILIGSQVRGKGSNTATIGDGSITDIYLSQDQGATVHTGNVSGSSTSTGSFGAVQAETLFSLNGARVATMTSGQLSVIDHFIVPATKAIFLDGGSDTFIIENTANQIAFAVANSVKMEISTTAAKFGQANYKISGSATSTGSFGSAHIAHKVGIGTTGPGTVLPSGWSGNRLLEIRASSSGGDAGLFLRRFEGDGTYGMDFWTDTNSADNYIDSRGGISASELFIRVATHTSPINAARFDYLGNVEFPSATSISGSATSTGSFGALEIAGDTIKTDSGGRTTFIGDNAEVIAIRSNNANGSHIIFEESTTARGYVGIAGGLLTSGGDNFAIRSEADLMFATNGNNTRMTIESAGNVGIGNTTSDSFHHSKLVVGAGSSEENLTLYAGSGANSGLFFADATSGNGRFSGQVYYNHITNKMQFATGYTGASSYVLELDGNKISGSASSTGSFGMLGIGVASPNAAAQIINDQANRSALNIAMNATGTAGVNIVNTSNANQGLYVYSNHASATSPLSYVRGDHASGYASVALFAVENDNTSGIAISSKGKVIHETGDLEVRAGNISGSAASTGSFGNVFVKDEIEITDSNTRIYEGNGNSVRLQTNNGYIEIGPQNSTLAHIYTDRNNGFFFNRAIGVQNNKIYLGDYNAEIITIDPDVSGGSPKISGSAASTGSFGDGRFVGKVAIFGSGSKTPDTSLHIRGDFDGSGGLPDTNPNKGLNISKFTGLQSDYGKGDKFGITFTAASNATTDFAIAGIYGQVTNVSSYVGGSIIFATRLETENVLTPKMAISSSGKVGIGTTSPSANLAISGSGDSTSNELSIESDVYPILRFKSNGSNANNREFRFASVYNTYGKFEILSATNNTAAATTTRLSISGVTGDIEFPTANAKLSGSSTSTGSFGMIALPKVNNLGEYFRAGETIGRYLSISAASTTNVGDTHVFNAVSSTGHLKFQTTSNDRMTINSSGVGIGTTSPSELLHVSEAGGARIIIEDSTASEHGELQMEASDGSFNINRKGTGGNDISIQADGDVILGQQGNVGIGESSPAAKLHVLKADSGVTPSTIADDLFVENNTHGGITIGTPNSVSGYLFFADPEDNAGAGINYNHSTDKMSIAAGGTTRVTIDGSGNVGIGETSPTVKLEVDGDIWSKGANRKIMVGETSGAGGTFGHIGWNDASNYLYIGHSYGSAFNADIVIEHGGNVGIGTTNPGAKFDILGPSDGVNLRLSDVAGNSTTKEARIGLRHYTEAEEDTALMYAQSGNGTSAVYIGGGTGVMNAVELIGFVTAATDTTLSGTTRLTIDSSGNVEPGADNSYNLGAADKRWANIFSADLQLSNEGTEGNEVDGTTGSWTIQEGEDDLYLLNRRNGKKYKFKLEEIT